MPSEILYKRKFTFAREIFKMNFLQCENTKMPIFIYLETFDSEMSIWNDFRYINLLQISRRLIV